MTTAHYQADELTEFDALIRQKLDQAQATFRAAVGSLAHLASNTTDDTYAGSSNLDDCSTILEREELTIIAQRQEKFIGQLKEALDRIKRGDYGVCRATGQLIPKERLRLVPHATLCVAAKNVRSVHA
jgi:RNA polymerase-binding transcription factor DksA